jgi:hypothetical protein
MKTMPQEQTAGLAKRLAEAADGFRDGKYYYFISKLNYDYDVHWASGDTDNAASSAADTLKNQLGTDYYKFGPYKTDTNDPPLLNYDSIELRLIKQGLDPEVITIPTDTDAIVLSLSAFDKFLLPYYTRLYGADVAADFRSLTASALATKKPGTHSNSTAYSVTASSQQQQY